MEGREAIFRSTFVNRVGGDKTGRVLRTIAVGQHDGVLDAVNAQAFVVYQAGNTLSVLGANRGQGTTA